MARSSKPRNKSYKPRNVAIPALFNVLTIGDEEPMIAHRLYAGIYSFLHEPTIAASNHLGGLLTQIAEALNIMRQRKEGKRGIGDSRDPGCVAVISAVRVFIDISNRYDEFRVMQVRELEAATLRAAAGRLDEALRTIPVTIWHEACHKVKLDEARINGFLTEAWKIAMREKQETAALAAA